ETAQISSHAPVVPCLGERVGGIVIRLCQIDRAKALDVIPRAGHQVRLDQIHARSDIAKEIDLHYLETRLRDRAIAKYLFLEQFVDRGPLILQVRIGVLAVNVEDDLTHAVAWKPVFGERQGVVGVTVLRLGQVALRLLTHRYRRLYHLLYGVRLSRSGHAEQRGPLPEKVLRAHVDRDLHFSSLKAAARAVAQTADPNVSGLTGEVGPLTEIHDVLKDWRAGLHHAVVVCAREVLAVRGEPRP